MDKEPSDKRNLPPPGSGKQLPTWFKLFAIVLLGLILAKLLGLQVFVEVTYDGIPFLASLTDVQVYFIPLFLVLFYILIAWIWKKFFGSRDP